MEMENSALLQMMQTQTTILEEIKSLRTKEELDRGMDPTSQVSMVSSPQNVQGANVDQQPFQGSNHYQSMSVDPYAVNNNMAAQPMQPINPTLYSAAASIPVIGSTIGMAQDTAKSVLDFNPSRMSKEAMSEHMAARSQNVQMGTVNAAGKAVEGVGMASGFLMGGLLPGLAVGAVVGGATAYVAGSMTQGAQDAINYQNILRKDGYKAFNAFESTTEFGGIGMKLDEQQELSGFMRDLSAEKFLDDPEMAQILQGGLDNKLLKSVSDVKTFKEKFTKLVDGVKEISLTLNKTIEESIEFMGEMERRGVKTENMSSMGAQMKIGSSMLGMDAGQFSEQVMQQTDSIVGGSSTSAENVMSGISTNAYIVSAIEETSKAGDGTLNQFIKNNGGGGAVAGQIESSMRGFVEGAGQDDLLGMFANAFEKGEDGQFKVNEETLNGILNSGKDVRELMADSQAYVKTLDQTDLLKLSNSAGQVFNEKTSSTDSMKTVGFIQQKMMDEFGIDGESALVKLGLTNDYNMAEVLNQAIQVGSNDEAVGQFNARALKEEMDSVARSEDPGIKASAKYWWKRNVTNHLGDGGQGVSDFVGDISEDTQMLLSGIEKDGRVGGELLPAFTQESIDGLYIGADSNLEKIRKNMETYDKFREENPSDFKEHKLASGRAIPEEYKRGGADKEIKPFEVDKEFSYETFARYDDMLKAGEVQGSDMRRLRGMLDDDDVDKDSKQRIEYLLNRETGVYKGANGLNDKHRDYNKAIYDSGEQKVNPTNSVSSKEEIEKMEKELKADYKKTNEAMFQLMAGEEDLGTEDARALEKAMKVGDTKTVDSMTTNKEARKIAAQYSELSKQSQGVKESADYYSELVRNTAAAGEYADSLTDFLVAGDVLSKSEVKSYFGDYKDAAKKTANKKDIANMSDQDLFDTTRLLHQKGEDAFANLTGAEVIKAAEYLTEKDSTVSMDELYSDSGDGTLDSYKVYEQLMDNMRREQSGGSAAEKQLKGEDGLTEAGKGREGAMEDFVKSVVGETAVLQKAVEDMKTGNTNKYTSVGR